MKKAIKILQLVADEDGKCIKLEDISDLTGINKSTCVHILDTLAEENMIEHVSRKEGYRISFGTFILTRFGKYKHNISSFSHSVLKWLTSKTGQTALICVLSNNKRVCIDYAKGVWGFELLKENIFVENIYEAATGYVLLADLSDTEQDFYLSKLVDENNIPFDNERIKQIKNYLKQVKRQGYAKSFIFDPDSKLNGLAVPIYQNKKCVAALGLAYYKENNLNNSDYLKFLKIASHEISRRLSK